MSETAWAQMALTEPAPAAGQSTQAGPATQGSTEPAEAAGQGIADIVVTAQRRVERTQDIPVAISAFAGADLARTGSVDLGVVANKVPSFYFGSFGALRPQLYIRGIGTRSFDPGSESSVGVFSDEVYLGRASGSFGSLRDVERIEVLRGPQGTLYGRNTIGGAINVITNGPTKDYHATAEIGVSSFNGFDVFGAAGGPIIEDVLGFRVTGWSNKRDGYAENLTTGTKFQGVENQGGRARLALTPVIGLKIDGTVEVLHDGDRSAFTGFDQGSALDPNVVFFAAPGRVRQTTGDLTKDYLNSDPKLDRKAYSYIGRVEYDAGPVTLTSISAWRDLKVDDSRDLDGSSLQSVTQISNERSHQFTQELRIASNGSGPLSFGGDVDWLLGFFYYNDRSYRVDTFELGIDSVVRAALGTPTTDIAIGDYHTKSYAVFGQTTMRFTPHFEMTLGGRYNVDKKRAIQ